MRIDRANDAARTLERPFLVLMPVPGMPVYSLQSFYTNFRRLAPSGAPSPQLDAQVETNRRPLVPAVPARGTPADAVARVLAVKQDMIAAVPEISGPPRRRSSKPFDIEVVVSPGCATSIGITIPESALRQRARARTRALADRSTPRVTPPARENLVVIEQPSRPAGNTDLPSVQLPNLKPPIPAGDERLSSEYANNRRKFPPQVL